MTKFLSSLLNAEFGIVAALLFIGILLAVILAFRPSRFHSLFAVFSLAVAATVSGCMTAEQQRESREIVRAAERELEVRIKALASCKDSEIKVHHKLHFATKNADLATIRRLLNDGADIEEQCGKTGKTPLHMAAEMNAHEIVAELITHGANTEARVPEGALSTGIGAGGHTALHLAAEANARDAVLALITHGANINVVDDYLFTPLHYAAIKNAAKIITILVDHGANIEGKSKIVQKGDDLVGSWTPLHRAAGKHSYNAVVALLDGGANIEARDIHGDTPLHVAVASNESSVVIELIDRGANVNAINQTGQTPLEYAIEGRHYELADMLQKFAQQAREIPQESPKSIFPTAKTEAGGVFESIWRSVVVVEAGNSQGSGVALKPNVVATNCHVTDAATSPIVVYKGENRRADKSKSYPARVIAGDRQRDVCLLVADRLWTIPAETRNAAEMRIAEQVYAVGAPRGLDFSISGGLVSQLREEEGSTSPLIQTDTAISPGSSGGGLFDAKGKLVGLTTFGYRDSEGLNFAVPIEWALELIPDAEQ